MKNIQLKNKALGSKERCYDDNGVEIPCSQLNKPLFPPPLQIPVKTNPLLATGENDPLDKPVPVNPNAEKLYEIRKRQPEEPIQGELQNEKVDKLNFNHILPSMMAKGLLQNIAHGSENSYQNAIKNFNNEQFNPLNYLPSSPNNSLQALYGMKKGGMADGGFLDDFANSFLSEEQEVVPVEKKKAKKQKIITITPDQEDQIVYGDAYVNRKKRSIVTSPDDFDINAPVGFEEYIRHQQGNAGANSIFRDAKEGSGISSSILKNMRSNVGSDFEGELNGSNFLSYWKQKYINNYRIANSTKTSLDDIYANVAESTGVPVDILKTFGQLESSNNPKAINGSYQGVMQLGKSVRNSLGVKNAFDPFQNIMAGAQLIKQHRSSFGEGGMFHMGEGGSFGKAFRNARNKGLKVFSWNGKKYTTQLKEETERPTSSKPKPTVTTKVKELPVSKKPTVMETFAKSVRPNMTGTPVARQKEAPEESFWEKVGDIFEIGSNGIKRIATKNKGDDESSKPKSNIATTRTTPVAKVEEVVQKPAIVTGDTLWDGNNGRYHIQEVMDPTRVKVGIRNRGDNTPVDSDGVLFSSFDNNKIMRTSDKSFSKSRTYIGVDNEGNMKPGTGDMFLDKDYRLLPFNSRKITGFTKDKNGKYNMMGADGAAKGYSTPTFDTPNTGKVQSNFLMKRNKKDQENFFGNISGGRAMFTSPDYSKSVYLSGTVSQIDEQLQAWKKENNLDVVNYIMLDNGSYSKGYRKKNGKMTEADWRSYDNQNTSGGSGIYLKGKGVKKLGGFIKYEENREYEITEEEAKRLKNLGYDFDII